MSNPLLKQFETPFGTTPFDQITPNHFLPALNEAISIAKSKIKKIKSYKDNALTFHNVIEALEDSSNLVEIISLIFSNLCSAETNDQLKALAKKFNPQIAAFNNDVQLDKELFLKIKNIYDQKSKLSLNVEQETLLDRTYRNFVRNGAFLDVSPQHQLREIDKRLAQLEVDFAEHVLNETNQFYLEVDDKNELVGLPDSFLENAAQAAKEKNLTTKWAITLDMPSFMAVIKYAQNRQLRKNIFKAYYSKGFKNDDNDNQTIILEIIKLRHERANLLGYSNHAEYVLEERMAKSPQTVFKFLEEFQTYSINVAKKELEELSAYARETDSIERIENWDFAYYEEKLKKVKFNIDDEVLRPYFQLENVINGVFKIANKLYGITFKEIDNIPTYHPDVRTFEVIDENDAPLGIFYGDFFPRAGKRNGAWMTWYRPQRFQDGLDQRPHVSIVCNFTKPTQWQPSLLTFNEVKTLFHEFGHALHGLLSRCNYGSLAGVNVYWDFVELPSQIMENWCYEKESLDLFATNYQTGTTIPADLITSIKNSAHYLEGIKSIKQNNYGSLDMAWHTSTPAQIASVATFENRVMEKANLFPQIDGTNVSCSFSHIFSGGYSSGYYSYKWAEVLDADAFESFAENGIFNRTVASRFRTNILSRGGSEHPLELYKRFKGREPSITPLLKRSGLLKIN